MSDVLVLNASYIPLETISDREAICMLYSNKAYSVIESDKIMRSPSITFRVPNVIALLSYNKFQRKKVAFTKLNVIYRDDQVCQYCGNRFPMNQLTIDHVIPKSRWKEIKRTNKKNFTNWLNCVCSCKWCNTAKGNRLPEEMGWKLLRKPFVPEYFPSIVVSFDRAESKGWLPFCSVNVRLVHMQ